MELTVRGLTKQYKDKRAVDGVSLCLTEGVNGLLGANGAGKTTLMRMLCGILKPTAGSIALDGVDVSRAVVQYDSVSPQYESGKYVWALSEQSSIWLYPVWRSCSDPAGLVLDVLAAERNRQPLTKSFQQRFCRSVNYFPKNLMW